MKVHIVCHSHEDVGWKLTPDEYYSGYDWSIKPGATQYVLSTVYDALMEHPKRKFTWVESYFFERWWYEQSDEVQNNVRLLIKEGRFKFVNGGWSMSDEATVHYEDFLNNMKAGHDFLKKILGIKPTIGWQIDPFGHQSATAGLFAEMGFSSWFIARADIQDKKHRLANKEMEYLWRPFNKSLGGRAEIFTHFTYQHYDSPQGFSYKDAATDEPVVDDPLLETFNVDERSEKLREYILHMSQHYRTDHLFVLFGDDFAFANSNRYFKNIDMLIDYINANYDDMELFYSTPYDYIEEIQKLEVEWPVKYDDHLPYSDHPDAYWTGFYTSRTSIKGYVRESSQDLNSQSIFLAMDYLMNGKQTFSAFNAHYKQLGVLQHHDAISGTENQHVADYYMKDLHNTHTQFKEQFLKSFEGIFKTGLENVSMCNLKNSTFTDCPTKILSSEGVNEIEMVVLNEGNERESVVAVPIPNSKISIFDDSKKEIPSDIICHDQNVTD